MREFSEAFFAKKPEKSSSSDDDSLMSKIQKSKLAKAAVVAFGLHAIPVAVHEAHVQSAHAAEERKLWNDSHAVLRPQSETQRTEAEKRSRVRKALSDQKGLLAYQTETAQRLESGEPVGFEELYFRQAELNGVAHEDVERARGQVEGIVRHFASKLENGLTEDEIRDISRTMYDSAEAQWGQGSVVDYFVSHKRNCTSYAQAQTIVFDRLIQLLPKEQRERFHLGRRFENAHQFAVMGIAPSADLPADHFIILQPSFDVEKAGLAPAGTATVTDTQQIKQALLGKNVVARAIMPKQGEPKVNPGPRIDAVGDWPVSDGIATEGALRSAFENQKQAERDHVAPMSEKEYREKFEKVMEVELRVDNPQDQSVDEALRRYTRAQEVQQATYPIVVDLKSFSKPAKEVLWKLHNEHAYEVKYNFDSLEAWGKDSVEALAGMDASEISFSANADGRINRDFIQAIQKHANIKKQSPIRSIELMKWRVLEIRQSKLQQSKTVDARDLQDLLTSLEQYRDVWPYYTPDSLHELRLDVETITDDMIDVIKKHPPAALHLTNRLEDVWEPSIMLRSQRDALRKKIQSLGIPVFVEVKDYGLQGMVPGGDTPYDWLLDDQDLIFPEFSSLRTYSVSGTNNHVPSNFWNAIVEPNMSPNGGVTNANPKAALIQNVIEQLDMARSNNAEFTTEGYQNLEQAYVQNVVGDDVAILRMLKTHHFDTLSGMSDREITTRETYFTNELIRLSSNP